MEGSITLTVNDRAAAFGRRAAQQRAAERRWTEAKRAAGRCRATPRKAGPSLFHKGKGTGVTLYRATDETGRSYYHTGDGVRVDLLRCPAFRARPLVPPGERAEAADRRLAVALGLADFLHPQVQTGRLNWRPTEERIAAAIQAHKLRDPKFYTARAKRAVNSGGAL